MNSDIWNVTGADSGGGGGGGAWACSAIVAVLSALGRLLL